MRLSDIVSDQPAGQQHHHGERRRVPEPEAHDTSADPKAFILPLHKVEEQAIRHALEHCEGNVVRAAGLLEVSPSTLYRKMQNWEDQPPR